MVRKSLTPGQAAGARQWPSPPLGDAAFRALFESITDQGVCILDADGVIRSWNPGAREIFGYPAEAAVGLHFSVLHTTAEEKLGYPSRALETARRFNHFEDEGWRRRRDGTRFWARVVLHALHDDRGRVVGFGQIARDLTRDKHREEALRRSEARSQALHEQAMRDPLTGAFNRRHLLDFLHELTHDGNPASGTLFAFDVDHFKDINDRLGHDAGDRVLERLASIASKISRQADRLFRTGGDEFLMHLPGTGFMEARAIAERLRKAIEEAKILEDQVVSVSIGIAEYASVDSAETWMQRADAALYEAKRAGRNRVV